MLTASRLAGGLAVFVIAVFVLVVVFVLALRSSTSKPSATETEAQGLAARLKSGAESTIDGRDIAGGIVYRVGVPSVAGDTAGVEGTHDGIVVCLHDGGATEAVRFSFLHYTPTCDGERAAMRARGRTAGEDRKAFGNAIVGNAEATTERGLRRVSG
jgi:hypothetical protein